MKSFSGEKAFLSNMYQAPVRYQRVIYPSAEHAYQAAKVLDPAQREPFLHGTGYTAKRLGKSLTLRPDWNQVKRAIMHAIVSDKFTRNDHLRQLLSATGADPLVEINDWGDRYWGVSGGTGENWLGRILTEVRAQLHRVKRKAAADVYIGRPGPWGNPFGFPGTQAETIVATRDEAVDRHFDWILTQPALLRRLGELEGKTLGCYCSPARCHGDTLAFLAANRQFRTP